MKLRKIIFAVLLLCLLPINFAGAANADIVRVSVLPFTSMTPVITSEDVSVATDIFEGFLSSSKTIALIGHERIEAVAHEHGLIIKNSGLIATDIAVELGRLAGCQYVLAGSVEEHFAKISSMNFSLGESSKSESTATVKMRVLNMTTGEAVLYLSESGTSSESSTSIKLTGFDAMKFETGGGKARAIAAATAKLANRIKEELVGEYSEVVSVNDKSVSINLDATSGIKNGDLYLIYYEGVEVFDLGGSIIGREIENVAVIRINSIEAGYSVGDVVPSKGSAELIRCGDRIEHISRSDAKDLKFVTERVDNNPER